MLLISELLGELVRKVNPPELPTSKVLSSWEVHSHLGRWGGTDGF